MNRAPRRRPLKQGAALSLWSADKGAIAAIRRSPQNLWHDQIVHPEPDCLALQMDDAAPGALKLLGQHADAVFGGAVAG